MLAKFKIGIEKYEVETDQLQPIEVTLPATHDQCEAVYHGFEWEERILYRGPIKLDEKTGEPMPREWLTRPLPQRTTIRRMRRR